MNNKKNELVIFNLSMDLDNHVLANTNLWVNEFSKHFNKVHVFSTHVGRYAVSENVYVEELGGGTLRKRIVALAKISSILIKLFKVRRDLVVFHHQSPRTAIYPGVVLKAMGAKQGLWYSHSTIPPSLIGGNKIVDYLFSSSEESLPLKSAKSKFMGHGVDTQKALKVESVGTKNRSGILFLGRIDRIKKLEECVTAIENSGYLDSELTLVGPTLSSTEYLKEIIDLAECKKVQLIYEPPIEHDLVFQKMANYNMFFAGMRNSVDKSCLEAAACGCLVITADASSAELSGMKLFWKELFDFDYLPNVGEQIKLIREMNFETLEIYRLKVQKHAIENNSADQLISRISNVLKSS